MWQVLEKAVKDFKFSNDNIKAIFYALIRGCHGSASLVYIGTLNQAITLIKDFRPGLADDITQELMGGPVTIIN